MSVTDGRNQPVLLSELLGGAARQLLKSAKTNEPNAWVPLLQLNPEKQVVREAFEIFRRYNRVFLPDLSHAPEALRWSELQRLSGLAISDWDRLTSASDIEIVIAYVIKALRQWRQTRDTGR